MPYNYAAAFLAKPTLTNETRAELIMAAAIKYKAQFPQASTVEFIIDKESHSVRCSSAEGAIMIYSWSLLGFPELY